MHEESVSASADLLQPGSLLIGEAVEHDPDTRDAAASAPRYAPADHRVDAPKRKVWDHQADPVPFRCGSVVWMKPPPREMLTVKVLSPAAAPFSPERTRLR